jgi:hypothetical protein
LVADAAFRFDGGRSESPLAAFFDLPDSGNAYSWTSVVQVPQRTGTDKMKVATPA